MTAVAMAEASTVLPVPDEPNIIKNGLALFGKSSIYFCAVAYSLAIALGAVFFAAVKSVCGKTRLCAFAEMTRFITHEQYLPSA